MPVDLERARKLQKAKLLFGGGAGLSLRQCADEVGLSVDAVKRASAREGWNTAPKPATIPDHIDRLAPLPTNADARAAGIEGLRAVCLDPLSSPRDKVIALGYLAEHDALTTAPVNAELPDLGNWTDQQLDELERALNPNAPPVSPAEGAIDPLDLNSKVELLYLRDRVRALESELVAAQAAQGVPELRRELAQAQADAADARAAEASAQAAEATARKAALALAAR